MQSIHQENYNFIVIEGNIGAGKTSLAKKIANKFSAKLILEQFAENPFLEKFYKEPQKYAFQLEMSFLAERYQQLKTKLSKRLFTPFLISDYYFMKSLIFATKTLSGEEYKLYRNIFNIVYQSLPKPDLYIYLHVNTEKLLKNIKKRGRTYEQEITETYLSGIQKAYFTYFQQHQKEFPLLIIDINAIDFVTNQKDYQKIISTIFKKKYTKGIHRVIL